MEKQRDSKNIESKELPESIEVKDVIRRYQTILVHGFNVYTPPHQFKPGVDNWLQKIRDIQTLRPELACSSYSPGRQRLYSNFGAVITGGQILDAFPFDAGTLKGQHGKRIIPNRAMFGLKDLNLLQKLDEAFSGDPGRRNEIVVANPKIGGLYLKQSELELIKHNLNFSLKQAVGARLSDMMSFCKTNQMPLYLLEDGQIFSTKLDSQKQQISINRRVLPQEIIQT